MNYLYNGVELPALPEWDRENYPYAYVGTAMYKGIEEYRAYFSKEIYTKPAGAMIFLAATRRHRLVDGQWVKQGSAISPVITSPLWSNVNIYYDSSVEEVGGTLYLAASDPIPVNPAPTLDPTALLMGWQVGNRIRQRTKGATE